MKLDHHRLEVYQRARQLRKEILALTVGLPRGHAELVDQLSRAVLSLKLNIAEGAGEFSSREKARFYRMARRSASGCGAALDDLEDVGALPPEATAAAQLLVVRIVGALVRLVQKMSANSISSLPANPPGQPRA